MSGELRRAELPCKLSRMLQMSLALLLAAALLGLVLAGLHLAVPHRRLPVPWPAWVAHATIGVGGFAVLLRGLGGPPRGVAMGVGAFGRFAAILFAVALLAGGAILFERLRYRRMPILLVGLHATLAIAGVVVLAAYTLIG